MDQDTVCSKGLDEYIGANIVLPGKDGASAILAEVKGQKRDSNGVLIRASNHPKPILVSSHCYQLVNKRTQTTSFRSTNTQMRVCCPYIDSFLYG